MVFQTDLVNYVETKLTATGYLIEINRRAIHRKIISFSKFTKVHNFRAMFVAVITTDLYS